MLGRFLDDSYAAAVRRDVTTVTLARLGGNACYRYTGPFLATIADGLDVRLSDLGLAIAITELVGLGAPFLGRQIDQRPHGQMMLTGMAGIVAGTLVAAASTGVPMFVAALVVLSLSKIAFDVALGAWIASHVPYERRGRVVGLVETSWALGLLAGVSTMGAVAALSDWRWGYVAGAAMVVAAGVAVAVRLRADTGDSVPAPAPAKPGRTIAALDRRGRLVIVAMFGLMSASQSLFVTFGAWLEDEFGFGAGDLAAVTFGLGAMELVASTASAARTDRWGKERSAIAGAGVMVPTGLALALFDDHLLPGVVALGVFIAVFEFAIVSSLSIGSHLVPASPARGLAAVIAAGTFGRALTSAPSTWLYEHNGMWAPAMLAAAFAALTTAAMSAAMRTS